MIFASVEHGSKQPRGANIKVPDASSNYEDSISIGMKKSILIGMHGHGFCCSGKKVWQLETGCPVETYFKLLHLKNQS
jgi:hypothetical protein